MDDMLSWQHKPCDEMKAPLLVAEVNFISRDSKNILPPKTKDLKLSFFTYFNHCSKYVLASTTPLEYVQTL